MGLLVCPLFLPVSHCVSAHTHIHTHTHTHLKVINRFNLVDCSASAQGQTFTSQQRAHCCQITVLSPAVKSCWETINPM